MIAGDDVSLPAFCNKRVLILGCGNSLFGDDGFGPVVAEYLSDHYEVPGDVYVMDVGTGVRKLLFTLSLDACRPRQIIIVDAVDRGGSPGEIYEITPGELPAEKREDFSLHQVPSSDMVRDLVGCGISVRVLVCQTGTLPESVNPGLSPELMAAVPVMCDRIAKDVGLNARIIVHQ